MKGNNVSNSTPTSPSPAKPENSLARQLLLAVAAADAAGIPAEFVPQSSIPALYARLRPTNWPFAMPGGGPFGYPPGVCSDDGEMSACLVRAFEAKGHYDADATAQEFGKWLAAGPRDAGGTIRAVVGQINRGVPWFQASLNAYQTNPNGAANGALMRNGVMAGMVRLDNPEELLRITSLQTIITHFSPLCVVCSAIQSYVVYLLLQGKNPMSFDWFGMFGGGWEEFLSRTTDPVLNRWREIVGRDAIAAADATVDAAFSTGGPFDPFKTDYTGRAGYVLLSLQIALWALRWSYVDPAYPFPTPAGWPPEVFARRGGDVVGWIPLIGNDCDTYNAIFGPMAWAAHKQLPETLISSLELPL
jgi:ADP-ribosylglycohydrolase